MALRITGDPIGPGLLSKAAGIGHSPVLHGGVTPKP